MESSFTDKDNHHRLALILDKRINNRGVRVRRNHELLGQSKSFFFGKVFNNSGFGLVFLDILIFLNFLPTKNNCTFQILA